MMQGWAWPGPDLDSMDLVRNFAQWRDQPPEQWIALANRYLPPAVATILILLLALKAADLTWRLLDSPAATGDIPPVQRVAQPAGTVETSYAALAGWEPFGAAPDESEQAIPASAILDAPDTTLNVQLKGVITYNELPERGSIVIPESGRAIIASGRTDGVVYRTGEPIENVGNVKLHSVYVDRVVLDRGGGRLETLRYPDTDTTVRSSSRIAPPRQVNAVQQPLNSQAALADAISDVAMQISQHMQITPATEGDQMIGFRVQPRGDGQVFSQLGLEPGDVLTEVNGTRLNDLRQTTRVLQVLGETQQANVTVRRNGSDMALVLDISQIQRIAESLQ